MITLPLQLVYGGSGAAGTLGDVWIFNVSQGAWSHASPSGQAPPAREMHSGSMISASSMMVFGGRAADGRCENVWAIHLLSGIFNALF